MGTISKIATSGGIIPQFADTSTYIHFFQTIFPLEKDIPQHIQQHIPQHITPASHARALPGSK
jgi:predicted glycoside hydrolase/deacetylase ChbG (UPF0249 family)